MTSPIVTAALRNKRRVGFTLLEVLVATLIMGIAVSGVLAALSGTLRNAARLSAYDRAVLLGRAKMDDLLADRKIPSGSELHGQFDEKTGWDARFSRFETMLNAPPNSAMLERVEFQVWWLTATGERHTFPIEAYRRGKVPPPVSQ